MVAYVLAFAFAVTTTPECPSTGETTFFQVENGFQGVRLLGANSYRSFFVGKSFRKADGGTPTPTGQAMFWLEDLMVQWGLVPADAFKAAAKASAVDTLEAHFAYEYGYLQDLAKKGAVKVANPQAYGVVNEKGPDGAVRSFKIWKVDTGAKLEGTQFWVTVVHLQGVVMLTIIAPTTAVGSAKRVIDSYMANFTSVDAPTCAKIHAERPK